MRKALVLPAAILLAAGVQNTFAYEFEVDVNLGFSETDFDGGGDSDTTAYGIGGEYYFGGVDDSKGPLAEAVFIDRASSIYLNYSNSEEDTDGSDLDTDSFAFGGRYVDKDSGWFFEAGYSLDDQDDSDTDTFSFRGGRYIADLTTLALTYDFVDADGFEADAFTIDVQHLEPLSGEQHLAFGIAFNLIDPDGGDEVFTTAGELTYYVNNSLGFGGGISLSESDDVDLDIYSLFVTYFPAQNIELTASYALTEQDVGSADTEIDTITLGAAFRF